MNARYVLPVSQRLGQPARFSRQRQSVHGLITHFATVTRKEYPTALQNAGSQFLADRNASADNANAAGVMVNHKAGSSTGNGSAARQTAATVRQPGAITRSSVLSTTPASYRRRGIFHGRT